MSNTLENLLRALDEEDIRKGDLFEVIIQKEYLKKKAVEVEDRKSSYNYSEMLGAFANNYGIEYETENEDEGKPMSFERFEARLEDLTNEIISERVYE